MRSAAVAILVVLLAAGLGGLGTAQEGGFSPPWFADVASPEDFAKTWNLRVPVRVANSLGHDLPAGHPVQTHLDLAHAITADGWPASQGPQGSVPESFHVLPDTVRLVEYTRGWSRLVQEVPAEVYTTWFEPDQADAFGRVQTGPFHAQSNVVATLEWRLPAGLGPSDQAYYYVYFDIDENTKDSVTRPTAERPPDAFERLDSLYWVGAGTVHFGYQPGTGLRDPTIRVLGLVDGTQVMVSAYRGSLTARPDNRPNTDNPALPFVVNAGKVQEYWLGSGETHFRIDATHPVIVLQHSADPHGSGGFVPSSEGGLLGTSFPVPDVADAMFVIAPASGAPGGASVTIKVAGGGTSTKQVNRNSYTYVPLPGANPSAVHRVTSDSPVMVQYVPTVHHHNLHQAPSALGAPVGHVFQASTFAEDRGRLVVTAWDEPTHLTITDKTNNVWSVLKADEHIPAPFSPVDIRGSGLELAPPAATNDRFTVPLTVETIRDDPPAPEGERGPFQLVVGSADAALRQTTPHGGVHGMNFTIQGPFVAFPFYDATSVRMAAPGATEALQEGTLAEGVPWEWRGGLTEVVRLTADKPVAVIPLGDPLDYARFLPSKPALLEGEAMDGQYRGYLVQVRPSSGASQVFVNGAPGETVRIPFEVLNLGKWSDGEPLADTISLSASVQPSDWAGQVAFETTQLSMAERGPRQTHLDLTIPDDDGSGQIVSFRVRATSEGNPRMSSTFAVSLTSHQTFGVQMWFGHEGSSTGPRFQPLSLEAGQVLEEPFVVENTGSGTDTFDFEVGGLQGDWKASVVRQGVMADTGPMEADDKRQFLLRIEAPTSSETGDVLFWVAATSQTEPTVEDRLLATAHLSLSTGFELVSENPVKAIQPGESVSLDVSAVNTGEEPLTMVFDMVSAVPSGWDVSFDGPVAVGQGVAFQPGDRRDFLVRITAADDAPAHQVSSVLLTARGTGDAAHVSTGVALGVVVEPVRAITARADPVSGVEPGESFSLQVHVSNQGNGPDSAVLRPGALPGGWTAVLPNVTALPAGGQEVALDVEVRVPDGQFAGVHEVEFIVDSVGGADPVVVPLSVRVGDAFELAWSGPDEVVSTQPGQGDSRQFRIESRNNAPDEVLVTVQGPAGWNVTVTPPRFSLAPGSGRTVDVAWDVPADAAVGDATIRVRATSLTGGVQNETLLLLNVRNPQVTLQEAVVTTPARRPGDIVLVTVSVQNAAAVPALGVEVRAEAGGQVLDVVSFDAIGPNGTVVGVLRWAHEDEHGTPSIAWGLSKDGAFEAVGAEPLVIDAVAYEAAQETPGPGAAWAVLVIAGVVLASRRRRSPGGAWS